jgi:hypothetical protein
MHFTGLLNLRLPGEIIKTEPRIDPKVKAELKRRKVIVAPTTPPVVETVREARRRTS